MAPRELKKCLTPNRTGNRPITCDYRNRQRRSSLALGPLAQDTPLLSINSWPRYGQRLCLRASRLRAVVDYCKLYCGSLLTGETTKIMFSFQPERKQLVIYHKKQYQPGTFTFYAIIQLSAQRTYNYRLTTQHHSNPYSPYQSSSQRKNRRVSFLKSTPNKRKRKVVPIPSYDMYARAYTICKIVTL